MTTSGADRGGKRRHAEDGRHWQRVREDAGFDQTQAAAALSIHPVTLSRYETGVRPIPEPLRARMAIVYRTALPSRVDPASWGRRQQQIIEQLKRLLAEQEALAEEMRCAGFGRAVAALSEDVDGPT